MKGYPQNNTGINQGQGQVCYQSHSVIEKLKKYQIYDMLNTLSQDIKKNNRNSHPEMHFQIQTCISTTHVRFPRSSLKNESFFVWLLEFFCCVVCFGLCVFVCFNIKKTHGRVN